MSVAVFALASAPGFALAQTASFPTSNPNADEWSLINLTPTIVDSANGGAGVIIGLYDGLTDCRDADIAGRCGNLIFAGGTYKFYGNHGTHTAGTIAGSRFGVATRSTIIDYAVFDDRGYVATGSRLSDSWVNAANRGASIASMSFGCAGMALCFSANEVRAMAGSALAGTLFVKAAGNDGRSLANESISVTPAQAQTALSRLILVGSVNNARTISTFSNRPGEGCLLTSGQTACTSTTQWKYRFIVAPGEYIYATLPGNAYGYMSGTSMATPIVAATAALLESRWPSLKAQPSVVADILFNSATDLGAPGVDAIYGRGLLNVTRAFQNYGTTRVVSPTGASLTVSGGSVTTSGTLAKSGTLLAGVTAYDAYGRDYRLDQVSNFTLRRSVLSMFGIDTSPLARMGRQAQWAAAFFDGGASVQTFASFGPQTGAISDRLGLDRSLRAGVDVPFAAGSLQLRITGEAGARNDFANDPALRPMSFFASSDLLSQSALVNLSMNAGAGRLTLFGAASTGGYLGQSPYESLLAQPYMRNIEQGGTLAFGGSARRQASIGVGYWTRPDSRTVVGFSASAMAQRHAFYDLASTLAAFDHPAWVFNFGVAASRTYGDWDVFGAAEVSSLNAPESEGPVRFTDGALVSGEVGLRRSNLFARGETSDTFSVVVRALPRAISGRMELDYLSPTADGLGTVAVSNRTPLAQITGRTVRLETSYDLRRGDLWSLGVAAGADLEQAGEYQVMTQMRMRF